MLAALILWLGGISRSDMSARGAPGLAAAGLLHSVDFFTACKPRVVPLQTLELPIRKALGTTRTPFFTNSASPNELGATTWLARIVAMATTTPAHDSDPSDPVRTLKTTINAPAPLPYCLLPSSSRVVFLSTPQLIQGVKGALPP